MTELYLYDEDGKPSRAGRGIALVTTPPPGGGTEVVDLDTGYNNAIASLDQTTIDNWYESATGFEAQYDTDLARNLTLADLEEVGGISSTADGELLYAKRGSSISINHNNVIVRGCYIKASNLYAIQIGAGATNFTIERVTVEGNGPTEIPSDPPRLEARPRRAFYGAGPGVLRQIKVIEPGPSSGFFCFGSDLTVEYCYIKDLTIFDYDGVGGTADDPHNSSIRCNGGAIRHLYYRNNLQQGTTAAFGSYSEGATPLITDIEVNGNILNVLYTAEYGNGTVEGGVVSTGTGSASWCGRIMGSDYAGYFRWINNLYGRKAAPTCGTSGPYAGPTTESTGNRYVDEAPA